MMYAEAYKICQPVKCFGYLEYPDDTIYYEVIISTDPDKKVYIVKLFNRDDGSMESGVEEVFSSQEAAEDAARQYIRAHDSKHNPG